MGGRFQSSLWFGFAFLFSPEEGWKLGSRSEDLGVGGGVVVFCGQSSNLMLLYPHSTVQPNEPLVARTECPVGAFLQLRFVSWIVTMMLQMSGGGTGPLG